MSLKNFKSSICALSLLVAMNIGIAQAGTYTTESYVNSDSANWDFQGGTYPNGEGSDRYKLTDRPYPWPDYYVARVWSSHGPFGNWGWVGRNMRLPSYSSRIYYSCKSSMYKDSSFNAGDRLFYAEAIDTATWTYLAPLAQNTVGKGYLTTEPYTPRGKDVYLRFISKTYRGIEPAYVYSAKIKCDYLF